MKAQQLADYTISFFNSKGDLITNKKLQKLLYYSEAWHLVYFQKSLIDEDFQAWVHGPVIPYVYGNFKQFGYSAITPQYKDKSVTLINTEQEAGLGIKEEELELLKTVFLKYGALSSFELEMLSHSEQPWIDARKGCAPLASCTNIISKESMQLYYSNLVS